MDDNIKLKINGIEVEVLAGTTIMQAAAALDFTIPTLCFHEDLCVAGNCRVCVVEQKNSRALLAACAVPAETGMDINTNTPKVRQARKHIIELLYSEHSGECATCYRSGNCELQALAHEYIIDTPLFPNVARHCSIDNLSPAIIKDDGKCIRCQRCVRTCAEIQSVGALTAAHKGKDMCVETFFAKPLHYVSCTFCGQCVIHCPTGALVERNYIEEVWQSLGDESKHIVVQAAPAVRVALAEAFGNNIGANSTGKMVSALRRLGFDAVFDTSFTADLTIMEEGHELLARLSKKSEEASLPLISSCSPGWVKFVEHEFPKLFSHLSTCKSPQQMFGTLAKTYYAEIIDVDPSDIIVVSVMPCTAKKFEADRPEMRTSGYKDVDYVLTTRELSLMIRQAGIQFNSLEDDVCDSMLGEHSGAGVIFGVTGGVMEAALRTVWELVTGREVPFKNLDITPVRGLKGIREASLKIEKPLKNWKFLDGVELKVAVAHGLGNARQLVRAIENGEKNYHFVEIMACPGGCMGGGGQPIPVSLEKLKKRAAALYAVDKNRAYRKSHQNPEIERIYKEFLGEPLSKLSHTLLHTSYIARRIT